MERPEKVSIAQQLKSRDIAIDATKFVAPKILFRKDAAERKMRLSRVVSNQIVRQFVKLDEEVARDIDIASPSDDEIVELAHLVLSPDLNAARPT